MERLALQSQSAPGGKNTFKKPDRVHEEKPTNVIEEQQDK